MRPYDGIDYRYTNSDADKESAIGIIQNILGFVPETDGLDYSLNFFSGGIGVDDRLAIRCKFCPSDWPLVVGKLNLKHPSEALANPDWGEDFAWLVSNGEALSDADFCSFVNANKREFQDSLPLENTPFFTDESNVNTWCVVWIVENRLNYLSFDQG